MSRVLGSRGCIKQLFWKPYPVGVSAI